MNKKMSDEQKSMKVIDGNSTGNGRNLKGIGNK
jgi:hypothetical protein